MKKNYQKAIVLIAILALAFFTRALYPGISFPSSAASIADSTALKNAAAVASSTAPVSALNSTDNLPGFGIASDNGSGAPATTYTGEANITGSVFTRVATTTVPSFSQHASLVGDLANGIVLAANNSNSRWPTASLTKLMTATVVLDHLSLDTRITITPQMFSVYPQEETLKVNATYTVNDLLHVMLMPSSNVAAEAMADYYGHAAFMAAMNQRAQQWGMTNTYFDDPSGLSSANQSSAHDLAILAQHVYVSYPQVLAFTRTPEVTITDLGTGTKYDVKSINDFAGDQNFLGGKTGYIPEAEDNLLSIFSANGHPVLIIVLGVADRFGDTTKLLNWFSMNYR